MAVKKGTGNVQQDFRLYQEAFSSMMVKIWRDRIERLGALRTGRLLQSVSRSMPAVSGFSATSVWRFVQYGVYVDAGTGKGYEYGNGGDLPFLGQVYRMEKGYNRKRKVGKGIGGYTTSGKPREKRPWFSLSWYISSRVMANKMKDFVGDEFNGLFDNIT